MSLFQIRSRKDRSFEASRLNRRLHRSARRERTPLIVEGLEERIVLSHFRGAVMIPSVSATGVLTLTSTSFWRPTAVAGIDEAGDPIVSGVGTMTDVPGSRTVDTSDIRFTKVVQQHTIQLPAGPGTYSISASSCCRVGGVLNAFEDSWTMNSSVFWDGSTVTSPITFNFSAVQPEVVRGSDYSGNLSAITAPGLTLSYDQALNQNIVSQPPGFTIDASTGALFIPSATTSAYLDNFTSNVGADYAFSGNIFARDASGNLRGQVEFDWLLDAVNTGPVNRAPQVTDDSVSANLGSTISHAFTGSDPNGDPLTWSFVVLNGPGGATPAIAPSFDANTQAFTWDTTGSAVGTWNAQVRAADPSGLTDIGILSINLSALSNLAPTANAGGSYSISEGSSLALNGAASSDPDGDPLTYTWDVNGDGVFGDATGVSPTLSWAALQALGITDGNALSTYSVRVLVSDSLNPAVTSIATTLVVNNANPTADAGPDQSVNEGDTVSLTGSFTDVGTSDTHSFQWHVFDENLNLVAHGHGQTISFIPTDNGTYNAIWEVEDDDGGSGSDTASILVANVAPTAAVTGGDSVGVTAQPRSLSFTAGDASSVDLAAGFSYTVNWGDGSPVQTFGPGLYALTATHAYATTGTFTQTVTSTDKDGSSSVPVSHAITIGSYGFQVDPCDPTKTALVIGGTPGGDTIVVNPGGGSAEIKFKVNGVQTVVLPPTGHVIVYGGGGNDSIQVVGGLKLPTFLFGGEGDDTIKGTNANNIIVGGPGDDTLGGGNSRDLIIGGLDADAIDGGPDDDILIGGTTTHDDDLAALCAIMDEWTSAATFATRVAGLTGATGLLGDGQVWDDLAANALQGASGQDLLFLGVLDSSDAAWAEVVRKSRKKV